MFIEPNSREKEVLVDYLYKIGEQILEYCLENGIDGDISLDVSRKGAKREYDRISAELKGRYPGGDLKSVAAVFTYKDDDGSMGKGFYKTFYEDRAEEEKAAAVT